MSKVANISRARRSPAFYELTGLGGAKVALNVDRVLYAERVPDQHAPRTIVWLASSNPGERLEVKEDLHELFKKPL